MALFKISKGHAANLPSTKREGFAYITTDEHKFYVDISDTERIELNAKDAEIAKKIYVDPNNPSAGVKQFADLQIKLSGTPTDYVTFNSSGNAVALPFPENKSISGEPLTDIKADEDIAEGNFVFIFKNETDNEYHAILATDFIEVLDYDIGFAVKSATGGSYTDDIERLMKGNPSRCELTFREQLKFQDYYNLIVHGGSYVKNTENKLYLYGEPIILNDTMILVP